MDEAVLTRPQAPARHVTLTPGPALTRHVLRGRPGALAEAGQAFGLTLPLAPCRAATRDGRSALWLGPDEYLLLSPAGQDGAIWPALASCALVDVSDRQTGLCIAGGGSAALLNAECPLDLRLSAFPVGMCTRTLFGKAEIVLWRQDDDLFYLEVWRSFAAYVFDLANLIATEPDLTSRANK